MGQRVLFTGNGDRSLDRAIQRASADGKLTKAHDGVYVENGHEPIERVLSGRWAEVLARIAPGAVLSGRSAMRGTVWREPAKEGSASLTGWIFATHGDTATPKRLSLPGLEIRSLPGTGPLDGDIPYLGVFLPSPARKLLDNLKPSRSREGPSRTTGREAVELEVERILNVDREEGLAHLRRKAGEIAHALDAERELAILQDIIGTVLGTREAKLASKDVAARRRKEYPYDPAWLERLRVLAMALTEAPLPIRPDPHIAAGTRSATSFIEAYFTNYIEGTRFLVDKARRIVFEGDEPNGRPADGRDITQTFSQVVHLAKDMDRAGSFQEFIDEIRERNSLLMEGRPEKQPGAFKTDANRAGNTVFVMPEHVTGTLREGFAILQGLDHPGARALFVHALLVCVHPFNDGNGRVSRIMMNKEFVSHGQSRLIVPTVFKTDYVNGLRSLSATDSPRPLPLIRAMLRCHDVTSRIADPSLDRTVELWASTHAFLENEKDAQFTDPDPNASIEWRRGIPAPASYWAMLELESKLTDAEDSAASRFGV